MKSSFSFQTIHSRVEKKKLKISSTRHVHQKDTISLDSTNKKDKNHSNFDRRKFMNQMIPVVATLSLASSVKAAETVGKDLNCNDPQCLGVWGGLLADCPHGINKGAGCASSQDDTPGNFAEPWDYSESTNLDWETQMQRLVLALDVVATKRGDQVKVISQINRYVRVVFTDGKTLERSTGEFYFTPDDTTVQFRVGSMLDPSSPTAAISTLSSMKNLDRCESIRKQLGYLKLPVLRNRQRRFFFGESNLDTFGQSSNFLSSPIEMQRGGLYNTDDIDPNLKIDLVQKFPLSD